MTKVAIYLRVSTKDQSTESQMTAIRIYCEQKNITNYIIYQDEGISGAKISRPGLDKMMIDIRSKKISMLIVYSFSRFARSSTHLLTALDEMIFLGVGFISITEQLDSNTPHGRLVFSILSAVAELERTVTKERVKAGIANAKLKGKIFGAPKKQINTDLLKQLLSQNLTYIEISKLIGVSAATICRAAKSFQNVGAGVTYETT